MEKVKDDQKKSSKKLKLFRDGSVFEELTEVGYIKYDVDKENHKSDLLKAFKDDPIAVDGIKKIRMPKKFTFIWINRLFVKQYKRGKGYGADILHALEKKFKDQTVVIGLSPGYMVPTTKIDKLFPFYEKQGFKVIKSTDHNYGFKVMKSINKNVVKL